MLIFIIYTILNYNLFSLTNTTSNKYEIVENILDLEYKNYGKILGEENSQIDNAKKILKRIVLSSDKVISAFLKQHNYKTLDNFFSENNQLIEKDFFTASHNIYIFFTFLKEYLEKDFNFIHSADQSIQTTLLYKSLNGVINKEIIRPYDCDIMSFILYAICLYQDIPISIVLGDAHILILYQTKNASIYFDATRKQPIEDNYILITKAEEIEAIIYNNLAISWLFFSNNDPNATRYSKEFISASFTVLGNKSSYIANNYKEITNQKD